MQVSRQAQAILLLTVRFSAQSDANPLTLTEWDRFAAWLQGMDRRPEDLLGQERGSLLAEWQDAEISASRLGMLLDRGSALAVALDRWLGAGLWVVTRGDRHYPSRLKHRLGRMSPPVLFGCGDPALLHRGGVAVVGSRKAPPPDLEYAWHLGARIAEAGLPVVSGGAVGIDEEAMAGALEAGGSVVGVLPHGLLGATAESRYRTHLMMGEMALISPYQPEARFEGGNAKRRNKIIYCLSDAAVAVHSGKTGGTFSGASQVLREDWIPLWVRVNADPESGNAALIESGGWALTVDAAGVDPAVLAAPRRDAMANGGVSGGGAEAIYHSFLTPALQLCGEQARTLDELSVALGLTTDQLGLWLSRAVSEERLVKLADPDRYEPPRSTPGQLTLFDA